MARLKALVTISALSIGTASAWGDEPSRLIASSPEMGESTLRLPEAPAPSQPAESPEIDRGPSSPIEYCGDGGDDSVLPEVEMKVEDGDLAGAYRVLTQALRHGEVSSWERTPAIALMAELQLKLGSYDRAVFNYRRALARDDADPSSRVGLAIALLRAGHRRAAEQEARSFVGESCANDGDPVACFGAALVIRTTTRDAEATEQADELARRLREADPDMADSFADMERLLHGRPATPSSGGATTLAATFTAGPSAE